VPPAREAGCACGHFGPQVSKQPKITAISVRVGTQNLQKVKIVTYCLDNSVDQPDTGNNFFLRIGQDKAMQVLFSILGVLIWTSFAFFNASLSADTDFCTTLFLHLLQAVATGTHEQPKEVDLWELLDWNVYLFRRTLRTLLLMVLDRGTEIWVILHCAINKANAFVL